MLNQNGLPLKNVETLRQRVRRWCDAAELPNRASHGIRKGLAELLARAGCSSHEIMVILTHNKAQTSEVYTKGAERKILSRSAMSNLRGLKW
ncbi:MAG: tyrosine-type recombinase/integrase [Rhodobacteraceae bacterium]|nr:tyrosine-type recombinase/integrase [Paracoccaceae bacterium]